MDGTVVIALFRHGLTEDNKKKAYLGWTDSPLCQEEKKKLAKLPASYSLLFSSDLGRCMETSRLLFPLLEPEQLSDLREMHFGEWEGKLYGDLEGDPLYQNWLSHPFAAKIPGGESYPAFTKRVERGWSKIAGRMADSGANRSAIMTHGGVIRHLLTRYAPDKKDFWDWNIAHGEGYELVWEEDNWRRGERCTLLRAVPSMGKENGLKNIIS
jgi:alpha-ribazole phosphatase